MMCDACGNDAVTKVYFEETTNPVDGGTIAAAEFVTCAKHGEESLSNGAVVTPL